MTRMFLERFSIHFTRVEISKNRTGIHPGPLISLDEGVIVGSRLPDGCVSIGGWVTIYRGSLDGCITIIPGDGDILDSREKINLVPMLR